MARVGGVASLAVVLGLAAVSPAEATSRLGDPDDRVSMADLFDLGFGAFAVTAEGDGAFVYHMRNGHIYYICRATRTRDVYEPEDDCYLLDVEKQR